MAAARRRNKAYRPKPAKLHAMNWAIAGAYTLPVNKQTDLMSNVAIAYDALRRGVASRTEWEWLSNAMDIADALAHFHIGTNLAPQFADAHTALASVAQRMIAGGSSACRAGELSAVAEGIDLYRVQLTLCSQAEMSRAVRRVQDLQRSGALAETVDLFNQMACA